MTRYYLKIDKFFYIEYFSLIKWKSLSILSHVFVGKGEKSTRVFNEIREDIFKTLENLKLSDPVSLGIWHRGELWKAGIF